MEIVIIVAALLAAIVVGVLVIHLLNAQHAERIAAFHYSDVLPGRGGRGAQRRQPAGGLAGSPVMDTHREHRHGARGWWFRLFRDRGRWGVTPTHHTRRPVIRPDQEVTMKSAEPLPSAGHAEVRIVAASPETARQVAEILRRCFDTTEQRSYPATSDGGTRLHLTVDTTHPAHPARSWLASGRDSGDNRPQEDEV